MDFYDVEAVAAAKKNDLLRDVEHLRNLVNFPHVPQRRDGDNRLVKLLMINDLYILLYVIKR